MALAATLALASCTAAAADGVPAAHRPTPEIAGLSVSSQRTAGAPAGEDAGGPAGPATTEAGREDGTIVAHATTSSVVARGRPATGADVVDRFDHPTERGGPLVFQAVGSPRDGWIEVLLPVRPNGTTGWVRLDDVELTRNPYRIEVDLDRHRLTVRRGGQIELATEVGVGTGATPTPIGDFYLVELLRPADADGPYGPFAYGLSGYSDVLDNFNGGEGVIGIHGTDEPELLGGPASHGCIRVHNDTITELAGFLPLGTPVTILQSEPQRRSMIR